MASQIFVMPHDVERLEHVRGLLDGLGHPTAGATLALYSFHGFHQDVVRAAAKRRDLLLIDLAALYGDGPVLGGNRAQTRRTTLQPR